ncbi:MAG: DUF58 domain-containing protein [Planctomycetota bacterium]
MADVETEEDVQKYLDPKVLARISRLDIKARLVVEGFISGLHKSPFHGFSVEFAQHREYVPGDDLKHLDWKVYAKTDRFYVKEYEEETNLSAWILLDVSESMAYQSGPLSKLDYGATIGASLAFLMLQQQDAAGLVTFDDDIRDYVKPSSQPSHLKLMTHQLAEIEPTGRSKVGRIFHDLAERIKHRGVIVLISDLFVDPDELALGIRHFRHKRHEVVVFHVMDEEETTFPFQGPTRFEGMEDYPNVFAEPRQLRDDYLSELDAFRKSVRRTCRQHRVDYVPLLTSDSLEIALSAYLAGRLATRKKL